MNGPHSNGPQYDDGPGSILVVEDNLLMQHTIKGLLLSKDFKVFSSSNGEEALQLIKETSVDLIICDVMMPKMDGYTLYRHLREASEYSHIPFIFLTALDDCSEIDKGKQLGADDYVTKPFEPKTLLAIVHGKVARARHLKLAAQEQYDEFRRRVIQTLSHEFRTPLVAISTGTELLLEQLSGIEPDKAFNLLGAIKRGGERLERLVNDFMVIQQIEGGVAARLVETRGRAASTQELNELIQSYLNQLSDTDRGRVACNFPDLSGSKKMEYVVVYPPHILDILVRLLSNAFKFGDDKKITLEGRIQNDAVLYSVRDRGAGFDLTRLPEALKLFGQLDRHQYEQQGGGVGLTVAHRYALLNGGTLRFERVDDEEGGLKAELSLPKAIPPEA